MTRLVRTTLWISAPMNLVVAWALAQPASLPGRMIGLPADAPVIYAALSAWLVAAFGAVYAWMATRPQIDRALLGFAAFGKSGVFVLASLLWLGDAASGRIVGAAAADLILAGLWAFWLWTSRAETGV